MTVEGDTAWIAGHIVESNAGFIQIGSVSYFYAIDNGEGKTSPDDVVSTRVPTLTTTRFAEVANSCRTRSCIESFRDRAPHRWL